MTKKALVPVADGSEDIETVTIVDVLRRAKFEVVLASVMPGRNEVTLARGCRLVADRNISEVLQHSHDWDVIALPGGMPGAEHLRDCSGLIELLKRQKAAGKLYAAICASPAVVFHHHGLLEGKKFTCFPSFAQKIPGASSASSDRVVVSGNCITSQGPGTSIEFALKIVEHVAGKSVGKSTEEPLLAAVSVVGA